jgi:hypothetical protein
MQPSANRGETIKKQTFEVIERSAFLARNSLKLCRVGLSKAYQKKVIRPLVKAESKLGSRDSGIKGLGDECDKIAIGSHPSWKDQP